jgi:heme/copper-type cytochrome/quinol oxidase subunit 2
MKIYIKDYNLQNIIFVHNFVLIFLIFVLLFVLTYFFFILLRFNVHTVWVYLKYQLYGNLSIKKNKISLYKDFATLIKKKKILIWYWDIKKIHNIKLEIFWTIVPILCILEMIFPSLSLVADDEIDNKGTLYTVGVIGNQWYWNYELNLVLGVIKYVSNLQLIEDAYDLYKKKSYTRLLTTTKSLPIAVGIKTSFYITSNDVAHSWAIPGLGIKVDAIPGRINLKTVIASRLGLYSGMCSELCGIEHGFMPISVQVLTFSNWWNNIKKSLEDLNKKNINNINDIWYISLNKKII